MTKINFSLKIVKQTKKHSSIFVRTRKKAYQASCLCSLFISSSLEDINRCKGKGRLKLKTNHQSEYQYSLTYILR